MAGYEIDFLPVGDGERSGDAIALRYGVDGDYTIHVVDGGTTDAGEKLVTHITNYYGAPTYIDHVVCTHGDDDHSSGLRMVIDGFVIGTIWMNRPWLYAEEIIDLFDDDRLTVASLERRLREAYPILAEIEERAQDLSIPICEAFSGAQIGAFTVLAPSRSRYLELIPQFSRSPEAAQEAVSGLGIAGLLGEAVRRAAEWISETWGRETLEEVVETSPSNESSVIQYANFGERRVLLTGDAGIVSLHEAADYAEQFSVDLPGLRFMQIPHHGSRHNVSPSVLNRWLGEPLPSGEQLETVAFVSVAKESDTHPRRKVVNAFIRRGAKVHSTKGNAARHSHDMPARDGWTASVPYEFYEEVEA